MAFYFWLLSLLPTLSGAVLFSFLHERVKEKWNGEPDVEGKLFPRNKSTFKILQLADLHMGERVHIVGDQDNRTLDAVERLLDLEKPDLVVLSGDVITGEDLYTPEERHRAFDRVADILENRSIPWAFTFGNHDAANSPMQGPLQVASYKSKNAVPTRQPALPVSFKLKGREDPSETGEAKEMQDKLQDQVSDIFQGPRGLHEPEPPKEEAPPSAPGVPHIETKYGWVKDRMDPIDAPKVSAPRKNLFEYERTRKGSLTASEGYFVSEQGGMSNYYLKVYASSEDAVKDHPSVLLWFLDTGGGTVPASLNNDQIAWLHTKNHELVEKYGPIPGVLFAHIPFSEYEHVDPRSSLCTGSSDEEVTLNDPSGKGDSENGSILALAAELQIDWVFVGHDHGNDWCCPVQVDNGPKSFMHGRNGATSRNIQFCYGRHSSYGGYSSPNFQIPGARVVEFEPAMLQRFIQGQSSSSTVKTWVRLDGGMVVSSNPDDPLTRALMKDTDPVPVIPRPIAEPWGLT